MTNEELYIKSRMGNKNPFKVPEGYFDNLSAEIMKSLPEQEQSRKAMTANWRPWRYAAAALLVAAITATAYFLAPEQGGTEATVANTSTIAADNYYEDVADYVMADNMDIYACLANDY
jgi:hypothetical protein